MFQHFNNAVEPYELSNRHSKTYEDNIIFYNNIINYNEHIPVNNVGENEIKFYKSPFPKEKKIPQQTEHYVIEAKPFKTKINKMLKKKKEKEKENLYELEYLPLSRIFMQREKQKKAKKNKFEGLMVIKRLALSNNVTELDMINNAKGFLKLNDSRENVQKQKANTNIYNNDINIKPISSGRNNRFGFYENINNNNNNNNRICTVKQNEGANYKIINNKNVNSYSLSEKPISTCGNVSKSFHNDLIIEMHKVNNIKKNVQSKVIEHKEIKYKKHFNIKKAKTNTIISKFSLTILIDNNTSTLKYSASMKKFNNYTTQFIKQFYNKNNINNSSPNKTKNQKQISIRSSFQKENQIIQPHPIPNKHPKQQLQPNPNSLCINSSRPSQKAQHLMSQSLQLKPSSPPHMTHIITPSTQRQVTETQNTVQPLRDTTKKPTINFKDLKCLLYIIIPGNASYLVKNCMSHRINWKETFSTSSSLYNFKWQQLSHGIDFSTLSKIPYLRQIVNHFEYHTLITHKANMFANLFKWCEDRNISVFKYVPFTIVHKILKEDKDNQNELKQKRLEEFISGDMNKYVRNYEDIGNENDNDEKENYADVFQWLHPNNKKCDIEKIIEDNNKKGTKEKVKDKGEIENVGKKTKIEIPESHWAGKNMWVVKAVNLNRGQCIRIVDNYQKMEKVIKMIQEGVEKNFTVAEIDDSKEEEHKEENKKINNTHTNTNKQNEQVPITKEHEPKKYSSNKIIIQKYIESPLLYKGRKCDIRIWVLLTHKMKAYVFKEGHLKTCSVDYNINSQDAFTHITNYSFQKYNQNFSKFEKGNEVPFQDFQLFIDETYPDKHYSIKDNLMSKVKEIVDVTMKCAKAQINLNKRKASFEIFGYDFMLDKDFNLFLIEINTNPGLEESSPWIKIIVPRMLDDALRLTIDVMFNTKYDHSLNYKDGNKSNIKNTSIKEENVCDKEKVDNKEDSKTEEVSKGEKGNEKENDKYISPFPVPGYLNDDNLWDFVCDLNEKDEFEIKQEEEEKEKQLQKEKEKEAAFTGIKHLINKRKNKKKK